jgi:hypothetical protein
MLAVGAKNDFAWETRASMAIFYRISRFGTASATTKSPLPLQRHPFHQLRHRTTEIIALPPSQVA